MNTYTEEGSTIPSGSSVSATVTKIYCCNRCGCAVINQWMHDRWHKSNDRTEADQ